VQKTGGRFSRKAKPAAREKHGAEGRSIRAIVLIQEKEEKPSFLVNTGTVHFCKSKETTTTEEGEASGKKLGKKGDKQAVSGSFGMDEGKGRARRGPPFAIKGRLGEGKGKLLGRR